MLTTINVAIDWAAVEVMVVEFLPVAIVVTALVCAVVIDRALARWRIRRVARQLGATLVRAPGRLFPTLTWRDGGRTARLAFPRRRAGLTLRSTLCEVELEFPIRLAFSVRRRGLLGQAALWLPARRSEVRTGHPVFDRAFAVRGTGTAELRAWLNRDVRGALLRLAGSTAGHTLELHCDGATVTAALDGAVTKRVALRLFAETAAWLARTVELVAEPQAIHFESAAEREGSTFTLQGCPACAEPVERSHAERCPVCTAPHHDACWGYLGGCGIWGCAGSSSRQSPSAA